MIESVAGMTRGDRFAKAEQTPFDVAIVGAGINGSVVAASLASHGLSTILVDRGDIGSYTSQASSNMIWGGFKYLESLEIKLVWDLCGARNRMISAYPTNVVPITFLANLDTDSPHRPWFGYLGTLVYWAFGRFGTPMPHHVSSRRLKQLAPVVNTSNSRGGIAYNDAYLPENDARFVLQFALQAASSGAVVLNHSEVVSAERVDDLWKLRLEDQFGQAQIDIAAKVVVNAAGPFSGALNVELGINTEHELALSKGIHLIVDRLTSPDQILVFYDDTGRLFYVLPMGDRSSIGTTDTRMDAPSNEVTDQDRDFLLEQINRRLDLDEPLTAADVISTRGGVRPLVVGAGAGDTSNQDWTKLSRKHEVEVDEDKSVISILGGKLTDCINIGEELREIVPRLGLRLDDAHDHWFGEAAVADRDAFSSREIGSGLDSSTMNRLWRRYGNRANEVLDLIIEDPSMAKQLFDFDDLRRAEVVVMARTEMVETLDDLLRRRTMLALTHRKADLVDSCGLDECAELLFGTAGAEAAQQYRSSVNH